MMWVRLFGLPLWVIGIVFTVFLVSISLQSFGRLHRMSRAEHRSNKCKRFKTKAGFGEGTPQQVRPECETRFQFLKLWPQVDTCLSLFPSKWKIQFSNWISFSKAGSAGANRSIFYLRESPLAPNLRSCPCVAAALFGSPTFLRGHGAVSRSRRLMQFSRFGYEELQAGRPAANSLVRIKKAAPQGTKRFCRGQAAAKWFGVVAERQFITVK